MSTGVLSPVTGQIFAGPLSGAAPAELLACFRTRTNVHYFAVPDENEVRRDKIDSIVEGRFEFVGESHYLPPGFDWKRNPSTDVEWLILLHKFYYAVGLGLAHEETRDPKYARTWVDLTSAWIDSTPVDFFSSDVAARRIQNWIFAHYYFITLNEVADVTPTFYARFLCSLHEQVSYLTTHLTPARNHRTLELWAIFLTAVVFPEFRESREWLGFSRAELLRNMQTDLLPDGVQCELSTDYHHLVLRNYLAARRLAAINAIKMPPEMDPLIQKALDFAKWSHTPEGIVPALSDGDRADYRGLLQEGYALYGDRELLYAGSGGRQGIMPAESARAFPASGYYVMRSGWRDKDERYLIFDCGPIGAGNHGHLDALNFEMAAYGRSLVVDPGRCTYNESEPFNWRVLFRSTAYHNTAVVDGRNQTRYEPGARKFKIRGPAPDCEVRDFLNTPEFDYIDASAQSHEYPVLHRRRIFFVRPDYWLILDDLEASEEHTYDLLFHLSAEAQGRLRGDGQRLNAPHLAILQDAQGAALSIDQGYVSATYGQREAAPIVRYTRRGCEARFCTLLYPFETHPPELRLQPVEYGYRVHIDSKVDEIRTAPPSVRRGTE